ncbi:MAG: alpha-1,4-glucan--maltose-1-phosphate maltosyltransferase [Chloroflexi bacterium]|nr:alpha-1,4-glucan--maltose-1-phosphate maltosyltransferase [Chloroflexota bacterium]
MGQAVGVPGSTDATASVLEGRRRVVVEAIWPEIDAGRFPIKRVVGDTVAVEADVFADGHDQLAVRLVHRSPDGTTAETAMEPLGNDRWRGELTVEAVGRHGYAIAAWIDHFATWRGDLEKRVAAGQDVSVDLQIGAEHTARAAQRAAADGATDDGARLRALTDTLQAGASLPTATETALGDELAALMARHPDRSLETVSAPELEIVVDPVHARFSSWYELFPRSTSPKPGRHGTLADVIARLDYVADLGFDVLYLPPIHPIGERQRKGPNNVTSPNPTDPGVPWAIGGAAGGHDAVHPDLGTIDDLRALVAAADKRGIRVALDIAFQASPDHPYVDEHRAWFRSRPDGTVQYAENPPKKYQDIYPFDFETAEWRGLWTELRRVIRFWMDQGVRIFRVDNPHTKPFAFWEWLIDDLKRTDPDVLFLAEAFTRPKVMYRLAKLGFSQSYTYFTWRNTKDELTDYFLELNRPPLAEFFRPNAWPNTPDILHEYLQHGGRPAFIARLVLAATLAASYGIYGPAFELGESTPREPGSEEYLDSEKYEIRTWDLAAPHSLAPLIRTVNAARRDHPALQSNERLAFHHVEDDQLIAYSKQTADAQDTIVTVGNLDPHHPRSGTLELPLEALGIDPERPFEVHDLLTDRTMLWQGHRNLVELDPAGVPAMILDVRPRVRSEADFDAFM